MLDLLKSPLLKFSTIVFSILLALAAAVWTVNAKIAILLGVDSDSIFILCGGVVLVALGQFFCSILLHTSEEKTRLELSAAVRSINSLDDSASRVKLDELVGQLAGISDEIKSISRHDAEFIKNGFLGLQRKAIEIDAIAVNNANVRYATYAHLPSHIRSEPLNIDMAKQLYADWTPALLLPTYTELINQRKEKFDKIVDDPNLTCYECFSKEALIRYCKGQTDYDSTVDPKAERLSRLYRLRELLGRKNYKLFLLSNSTGPAILLRFHSNESFRGIRSQSVYSLLIDLRLPGSQTNFEKNSYGVFTGAEKVCEFYKDKIESLHTRAGISEVEKNIEFIDDLIRQVKEENSAKRHIG